MLKFLKLSKTYLIIGFCLTLHGCETIGYYGQMAKGHLSILSSREKIPNVIANEETPEKLKIKLELVMKAREFAQDKLLLKTKGHYLHYVDLERPYVVWNVFAAPELSVVARKWCYPIVGCASYHGYYHEDDARKYAAALKAEGFDTYVGGVAAYSTLGWFKDPILNTFVNRSDNQLASLIFHELAHQKLYVKGDSTFNESFATVIAEEGLRHWANQETHLKRRAQFAARQKRAKDFTSLIIKTRRQLNRMYRSKISIEEKRRQKKQFIAQLRADYEIIKTEKWNGYKGYDRWFSKEINNARLVTVSTYHSYVPKMTAKLEALDYDLERFYEWCEELGELSNKERRKLLSSS